MSDKQAVWYLPDPAGNQSGRFTEDYVRDALRAGEIKGDKLCWTEGMSEWRPLAEVEPFASTIQELRATSPPAPVAPPPAVAPQPTASVSGPPITAASEVVASQSSAGKWIGRAVMLLILLAVGGGGYVYLTEMLALSKAKEALADRDYDEVAREAGDLRESFINAEEAVYLCSAADILEYASEDRPQSRDSGLRRAQREIENLIEDDQTWRSRATEDLAHALEEVPDDVEDVLPRKIAVARCLQQLQLSDGETLVTSIVDDIPSTRDITTPPLDGRLVQEVMSWSPTAGEKILEAFAPVSADGGTLQRGLFVIGSWCREETELAEAFATAMIRQAEKCVQSEDLANAENLLNTAQNLDPDLTKEIAERRLEIVAGKLEKGDATALNQLNQIVNQNPELKERAAEQAIAAAKSLGQEDADTAKAAAQRAMQLNPEGISSEEDVLAWIRLNPPAEEAKLRRCQTFLKDYPDSPGRFEVLSAIVNDAIAIASQSGWNRSDPTPFLSGAQMAATEIIDKHADSSGVDVTLINLAKRLAAAGKHAEGADLLASVKEAVPDTPLMLEIDQLMGQWRQQSGRGTLSREFDELADRVDRELKVIQLSTPAALRTLAHDPRAVHVVEVVCTKDKFTTQEETLLRDWVRGGGILWVNNDVLSLFEVAYSRASSYGQTVAQAALPESVCPILTGNSTVNLNSYRGVADLQSPRSVPLLTAGGKSIWSLVQYGDGWLTDKKPVDVTRYDSARFWLNFRLFCMGKPIPGAANQIMDLSSALNAAPVSPGVRPPTAANGYGEEYGMIPNAPPAPEPTVVASAEEFDKTFGDIAEEKVIWIQLETEQLNEQQLGYVASWVDSGGVLWTDTDLAQTQFGFRLKRADANLVRSSAFTWRSQQMHPVVEGLRDPVDYVLGGSRHLISVEIDRRGQPKSIQPFLGWPPQTRSTSYINAVCGMKAVGRGIVIYRPRDVGGATQKELFENNLRRFSFGSATPTWSPSESDALHTWVDTTGSYKIQAEYVKLDEGIVHLKKSDDSIVKVPLEKLSPEDRAFAKKQSGN